MQTLRISLRAITGFAVALPALALTTPAIAQTDPVELPPLPTPVDAGPAAVEKALPTNLPRPTFETETTTGPDGIETITRTRRIERTTPYPESVDRERYVQQPGYAPYPGGPAAPTPVVFNREQWLDECRRRTDGRSEKEKGGIIGGLLGAVAGGIIGNRVASGERLAGTLIGAGTGGLAGLALGNVIGGGRKDDRYDCEAALDGYLAQPNTTFASRSIPSPGYTYPAYAPAYGYAPAYTGQYAYSAGCGCQQPQIAWVPVQTEQRQRVIVRETVREELVPGTRIIPPPPSPKLIEQQPAPLPVKMIKQ
ncbi:MAG: hypothetical protein AAF941_00480 [Pseudomonadota bacterium]